MTATTSHRTDVSDSAAAARSRAIDTALVTAIRTAVAAQMAQHHPETLDPDDREALAAALIAKALQADAAERMARGGETMSLDEEALISRSVRAELLGLGRLEPLLADPSITDIHAIGCDRVILDLADGTKSEADAVADTDDELIELIRTVGRTEGLSERRFDLAHPQLNVQLRDGSRLFAVAWITRRPHLFIRRHLLFAVLLDELVRLGTMSPELAAFLGAAVRARLNILVAGGMGAGKTTLLRALAAAIPSTERIVTVETDYELALDRFPDRHPDLIALEAREANVEGAGSVSCADLVRWAMRMGASRIALGEILGAEVVPMLNAMHSGASGSLATVHANSSVDALTKLAILAVQAPEHLELPHTYSLAARAIDLVVFLARDDDGRRVLRSVREVTGFDGAQVTTNELWSPGPDGRAARTGVALTESARTELLRAGWSEARP